MTATHTERPPRDYRGPTLHVEGIVLHCPTCGADTTHVEHVAVSARGEDQAPDEITVDAITGRVVTRAAIPAPTGSTVGTGRRQRIALTGRCEQCDDRFALVLTQHKGTTLVELADGHFDLDIRLAASGH